MSVPNFIAIHQTVVKSFNNCQPAVVTRWNVRESPESDRPTDHITAIPRATLLAWHKRFCPTSDVVWRLIYCIL